MTPWEAPRLFRSHRSAFAWRPCWPPRQAGQTGECRESTRPRRSRSPSGRTPRRDHRFHRPQCEPPDGRHVRAPRQPRPVPHPARSQSHIDEQAVAAINVGLAERFAIHGMNPFPVLARRFRDQLLEPGAQVADPRRRDQCQLIAAELMRRCRGWGQARRRDFLRRGRTAYRPARISSARSRNLGTSTPMMAAGTRPKSERTE